MIHFVIIFVCGVRNESHFILLHVDIQLSQLDAYFLNVKKNHLGFLLKMQILVQSWGLIVCFTTKFPGDVADSGPGSIF